jgi:hypothetical protein
VGCRSLLTEGTSEGFWLLDNADSEADLSVFPDINLIPDWPRIRELVAKRLGRSEDEIQHMAEQAMAKSDSLLDPAELVMAIEEGLGIHIDGYPQS